MTREEFINWFQGFTLLTPNDIYDLGQLYDEVTKPHWISVEEELPKDGQHTATINKAGDQNVRLYSHGKWYSNFGNEYDNITHWMPLPASPKSGSSEFPNNCEKGGEDEI